MGNAFSDFFTSNRVVFSSGGLSINNLLVLGAGCWVLGAGCWVLGFEAPSTQHLKSRLRRSRSASCRGYGHGEADAHEEILIGRVDEPGDNADDFTITIEEGAARIAGV